jgi:hypothetical protein
MKVPILNGIYSDVTADFRSSYPINMIVVPKNTGISDSYLKTADGVELFATGIGLDRGGINWRDELYRVSGSSLIKVSSSGVVTTAGQIAGSETCSFAYSFDRLAIAGGGLLYYYDGATLTTVTDPDMGLVKDVVWVDGYFMTTDGVSLVVTELNNPLQVDPLKYGSSELDPDPIVGLIKPIQDVYAMNRYTIEIFGNIGGAGFPFQRINGAGINCGLIGKDAKAEVSGTVVFLGSRKNEQPSIYIISGNAAQSVSTREIDIWLSEHTEQELSKCIVEMRKFDVHELVYVHLEDATAVYDLAASQAVGEPVWTWLSSGVTGRNKYQCVNFIWAYNAWHCGNKNNSTLAMVIPQPTQYGEIAGWRFDTTIIFNETRGVIFNSLELTNLSGRAPFGESPICWSSWTENGLTWSDERSCQMGSTGNYANRLTWRRNGIANNVRSMRFRGANKTPVSFARLDAEVEPLA